MKNPSKTLKQAYEKKVELTSFFQNILDTMTLTDYIEKYIDWDIKIWRFILLFYCLKKTPLHKQIREKFLDNVYIKNTSSEWEFLNKLEENILSAKYNDLTKQEFFQDETWDQMYKPFKKINADWEKLIYIWIWYTLVEKWRKFFKHAYIEIVSNLNHPLRYAFFKDMKLETLK